MPISILYTMYYYALFYYILNPLYCSPGPRTGEDGNAFIKYPNIANCSMKL